MAIQEEIDHLKGVLAGLPADHPAWTDTQKEIARLRAQMRAMPPAAPAPPKPLMHPLPSHPAPKLGAAGG